MGYLEAFLRAIPEAAKSPYALIAYITSAILFIASLSFRGHVKTVLGIIDKVPEHERKSVIETALNTKLPAKLSGEQYLRREKTRFAFLASLACLVLIGGISTIAILRLAGAQPPPPSKNARIRVQLWPRPEIKAQFLKDSDARLYLKTDISQVDATKFVPTEDYLDDNEDVDESLIGKAVDLVIAPREKYVILKDRRFLTRIVRVEVYPHGKEPVPEISSLTKPGGEKFLRTSDLPLSPDATMVKANFSPKWTTNFINIHANRYYILNLSGNNLTPETKLLIVDEKGQPVSGAWAGNELGASNGEPSEVSADGRSLKTYLSVPFSATGRKLFFRAEFFNHSSKELPLNVSKP
jgi:hypothetical protein